MSIGRNIMVFIYLLGFGFLCFIVGACFDKNPKGDWCWMLLPLVVLIPSIFEVINAPTINNEEKPKKVERKSRK